MGKAASKPRHAATKWNNQILTQARALHHACYHSACLLATGTWSKVWLMQECTWQTGLLPCLASHQLSTQDYMKLLPRQQPQTLPWAYGRFP